MSDASQDRLDRIYALDTIMSRIANPGLTLEERVSISLELQIESTRALKLMLKKNFIQKEDLELYCQGRHRPQAEAWPRGRIIASVMKTIAVCATIAGLAIKLIP